MTVLGRTGLDVFPICLGGNLFGWTADEPQSRAVLDAYSAAGGNFVDTANSCLENGLAEELGGPISGASGAIVRPTTARERPGA
jgi:aryl-alcohol dehydrogenase-like predicted oxidoreductase